MTIILANILLAVGMVLDMILGLMILIVIVRAVISWVNPDPFNPVVRFLTASTEPLLKPLRRYIPPVGAGIDLTPLVLLLALYFLRIALAQTLVDLATDMKYKARISMEPGTVIHSATLENMS
ncbi:MAG: hypothetical protein DCC75_11155, partial [Proteobacteria bacterium]